MVIPRAVRGKRFDSFISWKLSRIGYWVAKYLPSVHVWMTTSTMRSAMEKAWGDIDPQFRLECRPEFASNINGILVNEELIPALRNGLVSSKPGIRCVIGPRSVQMDDGSVIDDVDAIVACTGYYTPFEPLGDSITYSVVKPRVPPQPDLYQNIFSLDYPDSLACLNYAVIYDNAATVREVAAMAVSQVFAGKSKLPSRPKMEAQVRRRQQWFAQKCLTDPLPQIEGLVPPADFERFVHTTAGTGLYEYLGWTPKGIWFFLTQPRMYFTIAWGLKTPHILRFFETGKRKAWPDAKQAILHANHLSQEDLSTVKLKTT
jgi:dimethylaniline monooxygenase (N-oxide forming)